MTKPITIHEIARRIGVSSSTVSRVLNGSKRVAEDKRALVLSAIEEFQYRPNAVAQGLARGRSMTVGVVVQNITSSFFGLMLWGSEEALERHAYRPMFASTHWREGNADDEVRALELLTERKVDGLLLLGGRAPDQAIREIASELPVIVAGRRVAGLEDQCLFVDNRTGAHRATRFLIGLGHTRIVHITGIPGHPDAIDRLAGYQQALQEAGLEADPELIVEGLFTEESGVAAVKQLVAQGTRFTAIFAANDQLAYGAMLGLHTHGFQTPNDVSVVGFDDQHHSAYTIPPLTTMRQPAVDIGRAAAEGLVRMIERLPPELPKLDTELIMRTSAIHVRGCR